MGRIKARKLANPKRGKWNYLAGGPHLHKKKGRENPSPSATYRTASVLLRLDIPCGIRIIQLRIGSNSSVILRRHGETAHASGRNSKIDAV